MRVINRILRQMFLILHMGRISPQFHSLLCHSDILNIYTIKTQFKLPMEIEKAKIWQLKRKKVSLIL